MRPTFYNNGPARLLAAAIAVVLLTVPAGLRSEVPGPERDGAIKLSLEQAVKMAIESDELLRQAGEGVTGAKADVREARSGRLPSLTLSGYYGRNIRKPVLFLPSDMGDAFGGVTKIELGEDNDFSANAVLSYNLWTAGRVSAGIGATGAMLEAMRYQKTATGEFVRFQVKKAYFDVLLALESLDIETKALEATAEVLRVTKTGFDQGTVSRFDLLRAEVEMENRKPQLVSAENFVRQAMTALRRRCGIDPDTPLELSDGLTAERLPGDLGQQIALMRSSSPEILALEQQIEAMRQNLRMEKAERWPVLQLSANFLVQSQWSEDLFPESKALARSSAVTLGFQIPIFDGFRAGARIDRANAELRSARIELERTGNEKEMAVRGAWLALESALAALEGRRRTVELAEEAHRLAMVRLTNGLATPVERLDAELAMTAARAQLAQALYSCKMARAQLELATGIDTDGRPVTSYERETGDE
ncbi:MAG TPA: TolC family protein [Candidatus Krumholzibacterium sp.]|nr:TolC family protein [Candidatus Krumholzibacterium sp.]